MDFNVFQGKHSGQIEESLHSVFSSVGIDSGQDAQALLQHVKEFVLRGGKRIRPTLALLSYTIFGGEDMKRCLPLCTSLELFHAFLLIHDDIMDQSDMRRGKLTVHKIYEAELASAKEGTDMAMLAGDLAVTLAYETFLGAGLPNDILKYINGIIRDTCLGQALDYNLRGKGEDEIIQTYRLKTSRYSIEGPLVAGAMLAGRGELIGELQAIAEPLGIAFQVQDDLLDIFGEQTGKERYRDLREGKWTLPVWHAISREKRIAEMIGPNMTNSQAKEVMGLMESLGSRKYCHDISYSYFRNARTTIKHAPFTLQQKDALLGVCDYLERRQH